MDGLNGVDGLDGVDGVADGEAAIAQLLIVDDDVNLAVLLAHLLRLDGHDVAVVAAAQPALAYVRAHHVDLVVLDIRLPDGDGAELLPLLRQHSVARVLMLSAFDSDDVIVQALMAGADDYVVKPFSPRQLLARIASLLRSASSASSAATAHGPSSVHARAGANGAGNTSNPDERGTGDGEHGGAGGAGSGAAGHSNGAARLVEAGPITIDLDRHEAHCGAEQLRLTPTEFRILSYLAQNAGRILTVAQLVRHLWGHDRDGNEMVLRVHLSRLRRKIEQTAEGRHLIVTRARLGYGLLVRRPGHGEAVAQRSA